MKKSLLILLSFVLFSVSVKANDYVVNDFAIDQMFAQAEQVSFEQLSDFNTLPMPNAELSAKSPWVAWALTYTAAVGLCGFHRLYLGSSTGVFIFYLCTAGGCGIVQFVDWIVLLIGAIENNTSKYENNRKLFMW